jgi:hypothetical protein
VKRVRNVETAREEALVREDSFGPLDLLRRPREDALAFAVDRGKVHSELG